MNGDRKNIKIIGLFQMSAALAFFHLETPFQLKKAQVDPSLVSSCSILCFDK